MAVWKAGNQSEIVNMLQRYQVSGTLSNPFCHGEHYIGISRVCFLAGGTMKNVKSLLLFVGCNLAEGVLQCVTQRIHSAHSVSLYYYSFHL